MAKPDVKFRNAKPLEKPYKLGDALGLYLLVNPSGRSIGGLSIGSTVRKSCLPWGYIPKSP
jgi:hypothetical protein